MKKRDFFEIEPDHHANWVLESKAINPDIIGEIDKIIKETII